MGIDLQEPDKRLKDMPGMNFLLGDLNDAGIGAAGRPLRPATSGSGKGERCVTE